MTYTTDIPAEPMFPRESRPVACQERSCRYEIRAARVRTDTPDGPTFDVSAPDGAVFVHESGGVQSELSIPDEWLEDVGRDIWGEHVLPWIEGLHRESVA